jgi:hypothetical protein
MLTTRIGLVDQSGKIPFEQLTSVAAALNLQVQRDMGPIWNIQATVSALPSSSAIPAGVWPAFIVAKLPPTEGGFHMTQHNQPYAKVAYGPGWTIAASHEVLEMLVDPSGSRLVASTAIAVNGKTIVDASGKFEYLVEVCDPSEADSFSYTIDDVQVSDFYTPHFYDPIVASGVRYSFTGSVTGPRQVLNGGYISWLDPVQNVMQQLQNFGQPEIHSLGAAPPGMSLRAFVDSKHAPAQKLSALPETTKSLEGARARGAQIRSWAVARAKFYK